MFERESRWVGDQLSRHPAQTLSPLLNIGSSTGEFRERAQPWTVRNIFAPLERRGVEIVHLDARRGTGIDICADLLDAADFAGVKRRDYRSLLCCNVLEHVRDPGEFARRCAKLVTPGGIIVVTVPRSYPHHGDPIDTLYRPTPEAAASLFPDCSTVAAEIIDVGESYRDEVRRRPWILMRHVLRAPVPFVDVAKWRHSMSKPYWLFHNYQVSAVVLERHGAE
jgi:SAM-dependent methyltransferase